MTTHALAHGFSPIVNDGLRRVLEGLTSIDEVGRVVDLTARIKR